MRVLLIDNIDSFTHNLVHLLARAGAEVTVVRSDKFRIEELDRQSFCEMYSQVVLSPGPGHPRDAETCHALLDWLAFEAPHIPTLGVCLGHQVLALHQGGSVGRANEVMHGKTSQVTTSHVTASQSATWLAPLTSLRVMRYHSWIVEDPGAFLISARSETGECMAIEHPTKPWFGVQFHPESFLTEHGLEIVSKFLRMEQPLVLPGNSS